MLSGIKEVESGGKYDAMGVVTSNGSRACGKYQIMSYNVPNWTEQYLGEKMTCAEFLKNPLAQEKLAGMIFTERIGEYGNLHDPVAIWFSGSPAHNNYRCDALGTCVPQYIASVLLAMR